MINSIDSNAIQNLLNFNFDINSTRMANSVNTLDQNITHDDLSISLDAEAQELMAAVGNSIQEDKNNAASIHQGLDYSRVMQLLEGL